MMYGEIAPGGTGSGLYGMLVLAVVTVFVAGLMVGRTPEYLGKKIRAREVKFAALYILTTPAVVLIGTGVAMSIPSARASMLNAGPHGLSEVLYAFTSQGNNNGSAFAGLTGNTSFYNIAGGLAMLVGRFLPMLFVLGLAGSLAAAEARPRHRGHAADPSAALRRRCSWASWSSSSPSPTSRPWRWDRSRKESPDDHPDGHSRTTPPRRATGSAPGCSTPGCW